MPPLLEGHVVGLPTWRVGERRPWRVGERRPLVGARMLTGSRIARAVRSRSAGPIMLARKRRRTPVFAIGVVTVVWAIAARTE